jgi:hypothetical protein
MITAILTLLVLLGTIAALTFDRYRKRPAEDRRNYSAWLRDGIRSLSLGQMLAGGWKVLSGWTAAHYPAWTRWIFVAAVASLVFQAAVGLLFEIFSPRGMFGLPLIGHMLGGGIFAVSLCALLLWRGRAYRLDENEPVLFDGHLRFNRRAVSPTYARKIVFWAFAAFGLVQVATAAGSMLPVFSFEMQKALLGIHRFGALGLVVASVLFADMTFIPRRRT